MENKLPKLNGLFFNVVQTAIENTAWKRADFDKVAEAESQLKALSFFYRDYYAAEKIKAEAANANVKLSKEIDEAKEAIAGPEKVAPVEIDIPKTEEPKVEAPEVGIAGPGPKVPVLEVKPPLEETPMPDAIAEMVKDRVAAAKQAKPVNKNIKVSESVLPENVDEYIKNP
ncbi:hypothetical protein KAU51_03965 [Candidatus Parcubacteria bacterium]|nr:hypothetical protein [Candidatus Parcubacteria bacterium]